MSCFQLPQGLIKEIQSPFRISLELSGRTQVALLQLCASKEVGGLGFREVHYFNLALLAKQGCMLILEPESMLASVLKARYVPRTDFMNASLSFRPSMTWRGIIATQLILKAGCRWRAGDGRDIHAWLDAWLPWSHHFRPLTRPPDNNLTTKVCDFLLPVGKGGTWMLLVLVFTKMMWSISSLFRSPEG
ncbi:UNVERIFIED_CONTAM: putative mitochondrial protein [Sesamum latifolium]|uniref:Mitochondrial protein n=1 Tax=Sesamum latifolium TaxID=2727402 RepID=A0AAW2UL22_9LAMI